MPFSLAMLHHLHVVFAVTIFHCKVAWRRAPRLLCQLFKHICILSSGVHTGLELGFAYWRHTGLELGFVYWRHTRLELGVCLMKTHRVRVRGLPDQDTRG